MHKRVARPSAASGSREGKMLDDVTLDNQCQQQRARVLGIGWFADGTQRAATSQFR